MPSPYGRQRPTRTRARLPSAATASRIRRDLPIPGAPSTVASSQRDAATARSNAASSDASSLRRPTNGVLIGREKAGTSGRTLIQAPRRNRLGFAFERQVGHKLHQGRLAQKTGRLVAEEDFARPRALLRPRGDIDRVTGDERLPVSRDHVAGVQGGAHLDFDPVVALEIDIDRPKRDPHVGCGTCGPKRVVFVGDWQAEDSHHFVAAELLNRAAVTLKRNAHRLVPACQHLAQRLRIKPLAQ
jgi:hypothetical protein